MLGFFNVIKPTGVSSSYVVGQIKHAFHVKTGHLGTLDPMASGVLPIAVGNATKFFNYFLNKDKTYVALMKFGVMTDSLDSDGKVVATSEGNVHLKDVQKAAESLVGETMQVPPSFSAKSINGKRAYQIARDDKEVKLAAKKTQIYSINVEKWCQNDVFRLKIHCSSGTYVRAIVRDIAEKLGQFATCVAIIRVASGPFKIENATSLEEVLGEKRGFIKLNDVLQLPEIELTENEAKDLFSGKSVVKNLSNGEYITSYCNQTFSLAEVSDNKLKNKIYLYEKEKI